MDVTPSFEVEEWYRMPPDRAMAGVDLFDDRQSLDVFVGTAVRLTRSGRAKVFMVVGVEPPLPQHMPPYRRGERIGLVVQLEGDVA